MFGRSRLSFRGLLMEPRGTLYPGKPISLFKYCTRLGRWRLQDTVWSGDDLASVKYYWENIGA